MVDFTLHYWPIPFRGQFVRAVLAQARVTWREAGLDETAHLRLADPADQAVPHLGPPVLTDHTTSFSLSQMPAILGYLGQRFGLVPGDAERAAMTAKIVADCNDVLNEMTRHNGAQMWTASEWQDFQPRLRRWMAIFEETGRRHGLSADAGHMLGTDTPGIADLATAVLWGVMTDKLRGLRPILDQSAPAVAGLSDRIFSLPEQADLKSRSDAEYGEAWCSGQIEASLRSVI